MLLYELIMDILVLKKYKFYDSTITTIETKEYLN